MKRQDGVKESSQARRYALLVEVLKEVEQWHYDGSGYLENGLPWYLFEKVRRAVNEASKIGDSE